MKNKQNFTGFTLIELLVVIVIIGILATISVSTFGGYFEKARLAKAQQSYSQIKSLFLAQNASTEENLFTTWYSFDGNNHVNTSNPYIIDISETKNHQSQGNASGNYSQSDDTGIGIGKSLYTNKSGFARPYNGSNWPTDNLTIAFWEKMSEMPSSHYMYPILIYGRVRVMLRKTGAIGFDIGGTDGGHLISSANLIKPGTWNYIVLSYENATMRIFLDGNLVAEKKGVISHNAFNRGINIGYGGNAYAFHGWLDEVMVMPYGFDGKELK